MYKPVHILIHADIGKKQFWIHRRGWVKFNSRNKINPEWEIAIIFLITPMSVSPLHLRGGINMRLIGTHYFDIIINILLIIAVCNYPQQVNTVCYCSPAWVSHYFCLGALYVNVSLFCVSSPQYNPQERFPNVPCYFGLYSWKIECKSWNGFFS